MPVIPNPPVMFKFALTPRPETLEAPPTLNAEAKFTLPIALRVEFKTELPLTVRLLFNNVAPVTPSPP